MRVVVARCRFVAADALGRRSLNPETSASARIPSSLRSSCTESGCVIRGRLKVQLFGSDASVQGSGLYAEKPPKSGFPAASRRLREGCRRGQGRGRANGGGRLGRNLGTRRLGGADEI